MLLKRNLGVKPTWLFRETGNSAPEADPRNPPNLPKKYCGFKGPKMAGVCFGGMLGLVFGLNFQCP